MFNKKFILAILASFALFSNIAAAETRTAFVHLFEWKWTDIAIECETFLGPKGFAAVQVSPPNEHIDGNTWWTRYQPVSYKLNSRSGNEAEFKDMVKRCNAVNVDIYVDAVINHMAAWNRDFPGVPYSSNDFHTCTHDINYGDRWEIFNCDLSGLNDLKTESGYVQDKIAEYMNRLIDMGVAGFRIDAAKHMPPGDIQAIKGKLKNNPYIFQEVIQADSEPVSAGEYTGAGDVTEFNYAKWIGGVFRNGQISSLGNLGNGILNSNSAVVFTDNHDNQRGHGGGGENIVTFQDGDTYNLANIYMLAWPYGYPKVMSSYEFHGDTDAGPPSSKIHNGSNINCGKGEWVCEHRWTGIANMVGFRNATNGQSVQNWWDNGNNQVAFSRGNKGFLVMNKEGGTLNKSFATGMPAGDYCNVIHDDECSQTITVDNSGNAQFNVGSMSAAAIYVGGGEQDGTPKAIIKASATTVPLNGNVTLDAASSTDPDGTITSYLWNTGETTASISKQLDDEGYNTFTVTVTDNDGNTATTSVDIYAGDKPPTGNFSNLNLRGTINDWGITEMSLIADNTWQLKVDFTGDGDSAGGQRFKFDEGSDWTSSWGDSNNDGKIDQNPKNDISTNVKGCHIVTVNDKTYQYSIEECTVTVDEPPVAIISPNTKTIKIGESITFSAAASTDDKGIESYKWNDGSSKETVTMTFDTVGSQNVSVTVTDIKGQSSIAKATITVEAIDDPTNPVDTAPVAKLTPSQTTVIQGEELTLSAASSTDDNKIVKYTWSTGENTPSITLRYNTIGNYEITVTVTDALGQTDTATAKIEVKTKNTNPITDEAPTAKLTTNATEIFVGDNVMFSAQSSTDDKGIATYLWSNNETNDVTTVKMTTAGIYRISVTVTDTSGQTDTATIEVTVKKVKEPVVDNSGSNKDSGAFNWQLLLILGLIAMYKRRSNNNSI